MTLSITIRGKKLTQEQLDAIVPVINARMHGEVSKKKFEDTCVQAMADAGCPLAVEQVTPNAVDNPPQQKRY